MKIHLPVAPTSASSFQKPKFYPEDLSHRDIKQGLFWQKIPTYQQVDESTFLDHKWQAKNSITHAEKLVAMIQEFVSAEFCQDVLAAYQLAPMSMRISPYLLSLIDWQNPYLDPLRKQFVPIASQLLKDHPQVGLDSLAEVAHSPVPGLTHRYPDKALFLTLDTCPVYCRFCTRSYAVGMDTPEVEKVNFRVNDERWKQVFAYLAENHQIEDVVISGGDAFQLRAQQILEIGENLLSIPNIRRFRYATKGLAVMPQKIVTDTEWVDAMTKVVERGRKLRKEVVIHTHFNHPHEITSITESAMNILSERGITVRNQSVLLRGVNDSVAVMQLLIKRLAYLNIHPYYVFVHDLVQGVEDLRTTVNTAILLEKSIRGLTAGFYTPTFVVDLPGGGGKRDVHSLEYYDPITGVSVYQSPVVRPGEFFYYFDPIDLLPEEGQKRWADPLQHSILLQEAGQKARQKRF